MKTHRSNYFWHHLFSLILLGCIPLLLARCDEQEVPAFDCSKSLLTLSGISITPATSCDTPDGSLNWKASGGKEPYTYYLNNAEVNLPVSNLKPGIYILATKDANGCERQVQDVVVQAADLDFASSVNEDTQCVGANGSIEIIVPNPDQFSYALNAGSFQTLPRFEGLETGNYVVKVKDAENCIISLNLIVPSGDTETSWVQTIKPILTTNCALSGCHNGATRKDFTVYSNVKASAAAIKSRTASGNMPPDKTLTASQIKLIECWVNEGAVEN